MAGRPRKVKLEQRSKNGKYTIHFYDFNGDKQRENTGLIDKELAEVLKERIAKLQSLNLPPGDESLKGFDSQAFDLFYQLDSLSEIPVTDKTYKIGQEFYKDKDPILSSMNVLKEVERLRDELITTKEELHKYKTLWLSYKETETAMVIEAYNNSPSLKDAVETYIDKSLCNLFAGGSNDKTTVNRLVDHLPHNPRLSEIKPSEISEFIEKWCIGDYKFPKKRYNTLRKHVNRFFNWAYKMHDVQSPMRKVDSMRRVEFSEITYFDYDYLDEMISGLELYWKAVVSTLCFAGLRRNELLGLRVQDIYKSDGKYFIRVIDHEERTLKNNETGRDIPVSEKRLKPIIVDYLNSDLPGEKYLFPALNGRGEMWKRTSFNLKFMDAVPDGVDCRSLRRSFNQNNIRSGMSREDTSILSGHSVTVNAKHYARKEAKEIDLE